MVGKPISAETEKTPSVRSWADAARLSLSITDAKLSRRFDHGTDIDYLLALRARAVDHLVQKAWTANIPPAAGLSLFAVGGYGRGELFPRSDVDLLILGAEAAQQQHQAGISQFFSHLWDAGLPVGHAVRSAGQCTRACAEDQTVMTALIEARALNAGPEAREALAAAIATDKVWPPGDFFRAKREELLARHQRFGDTSDNLEPNIKEGPGGLRDIQTLGWMAQRAYGVRDLDALVWQRNLGADEAAALNRERRTLARLRFGLHLVAGRAEERLLFDYQKTLARRMGFDDDTGNMAVENMMQDFYRSAAIVRRISDRLLQRFEEKFNGEAPPQPLDAHFALRGDYLAALDPTWPHNDLGEIFALFEVWAHHPDVRNLHSLTARELAESLEHLPDYGHAGQAARARFMALLRGPHPVATLTRLSRLGVLGQYLPAYAQVTGRMQFDLFHVYTVDQHTLMVLRNISVFASGVPDARFSIAHEVWPRLHKPELLLLAGLFHDIGKGRGGDHSELGAVDATGFCLAHGLGQADADMVSWLVRQHLRMSVTAQKQDISDPRVLHDFTEAVGERERLDYLYLLTCADIAGTSPKLWNAWKDRLLADLYLAARRALREGREKPMVTESRTAETKNAVRLMLREQGWDDATIDRQFGKMPEESYLRFRLEQLVWQVVSLIDVREGDTLVRVRKIGSRDDALELFVHSPDRDGLFAAIMATLSRQGYGVHQARALPGPDGTVSDTFEVVPSDNFAGGDPEALARALRQALAGPLDQVRAPRRVMPRQLRHFRFAPKIEFQLSPGARHTILGLTCPDRPGLLADITQVLRDNRLRVHDARIATFGERAEDIFQITDENDLPLDQAAQTSLCETIHACLDPDTSSGAN
ncbi:MAG: [protein-PII] uridylyltransferase [Xanthomonadaceae bacterium]|jgi:[protein-PII] uridylyltransferase|nr:[protein-PII] uridylyltransferase [Xanthomonadaceae bacterium]